MIMNITTADTTQITERTGELFKTLGHPVRLHILMEIGEGEACVCHLESVLEQRQAYISQQLMVLRDAGLLATRQEGRYVFYSLRDPQTLALIDRARKLLELPARPQRTADCDCPCPNCHTP